MKTIRIRVTEDDIAKGTRECPWNCPAAIAINRETGSLSYVGSSFVILTKDVDIQAEIDSPAVLQKFVAEYDSGIWPGPIEFDLPLSE